MVIIIYTSKDIQELDTKIDNLIIDYSIKNNMDINDYSFRVNIKHLEVMNICRYINNKLFSDIRYYATENYSLIDYDDIELFVFLCNKFLNICNYFNKSLGLETFGVFIGVSNEKLWGWMNGDETEQEKPNPTRSKALRKIYRYNQDALVSNLKNTTLGMVAVANNDKATGLEWTKNQAQQVTKNTVYLLPSERLERLRLSDTAEAVNNP